MHRYKLQIIAGRKIIFNQQLSTMMNPKTIVAILTTVGTIISGVGEIIKEINESRKEKDDGNRTRQKKKKRSKY